MYDLTADIPGLSETTVAALAHALVRDGIQLVALCDGTGKSPAIIQAEAIWGTA